MGMAVELLRRNATQNNATQRNSLFSRNGLHSFE
jgi:hypothetical protein